MVQRQQRREILSSLDLFPMAKTLAPLCDWHDREIGSNHHPLYCTANIATEADHREHRGYMDFWNNEMGNRYKSG